MSEKHWMDEEYGVPHKNGHVRFYYVGVDEDVYGYLGWFDMTDWDEGWEKVWAAAKAAQRHKDAEFNVLRHDQMLDLMHNVHWAIEEALEVEGETTFHWWYNKEKAEEK